jgi:hypothetical protein
VSIVDDPVIPDAMEPCGWCDAVCPIELAKDPVTGEELEFRPVHWHRPDCLFAAPEESECPF